MIIAPPPGIMLGYPPVSPKPVWTYGFNVRFRLGMIETIGLFGPVRNVAGDRMTLPGASVYRKVFTTPSAAQGQVVIAAHDDVQLMDYDPASTPATGTRWRMTPLTPAGLTPASDIISNPSAATVEIPPVWWFSDQDDLVVGCRANVNGEPCYAWDRDRANDFVPLANSPTGAVGGGILNRILVLIGCTSFTDPDPQRFMTIRWSDRFNFEEWTPSDINVSGELQLEGGSRLVGGGITGFGVIAWTDKRMALLTETFDPNSVFDRRYVDGGRGLMANNAWTEADGAIYWYDESRVLNIYEGGRPRQIVNPLKYASIDRIEQSALPRAYLEPNPEYGEVILHYPDTGSEECDTQLVYNYLEDAWSLWRLERSGWHQRVGVVPNIAVNELGEVLFHDLDTGLPDAYIAGPPTVPWPLSAASQAPDAADVDPTEFLFGTNLITTEDVTDQVWRATRLLLNYLPAPADGADDFFTVTLTGYGKAQVETTLLAQDVQDFMDGDTAHDFRVGGKALQVNVTATDIKTVYRFAQISVTEGQGGSR